MSSNMKMTSYMKMTKFINFYKKVQDLNPNRSAPIGSYTVLLSISLLVLLLDPGPQLVFELHQTEG